MNWKHGWRLGAHREKTEFLLTELVAECLDVVARLSKLAIAYFPTRITAEHGNRYGHTADQLTRELQRHAGKVRQRIVLHDTQIFGERGEDGGPGLLVALRAFLREFPGR